MLDTLMLCTPLGELIEFKLSPSAALASRGTLRETGICVPSQLTAASGVMVTMGSMFDGMRGMVSLLLFLSASPFSFPRLLLSHGKPDPRSTTSLPLA